MMSFKWKPSKSQRRAFAEKMSNDLEYATAYNARKKEKEDKRRESSKFDYAKAGGFFVATKNQYYFAFNNLHLAMTSEEKDAFNQVIYSFTCNEKIHHDYIHIINEKLRNYETSIHKCNI